MMRFVLNALIAKKNAFGGFRVSCDFFRRSLQDKTTDWFYLISQDVADALQNEIPVEYYNQKVFVYPNQPDFNSYLRTRKAIRTILEQISPDVVYSVVAPSYFEFDYPEVMRCANAWTVVGGVNEFVLRVTPFKLKVRRYIIALITRWQMRKAKYFITQSRIAKQCILRTVHTDPDNVFVVSNVLSRQFMLINYEKERHEGYNMVYASSPAYHKDYLVLPQMASILINKYGMRDFKIHVTMPEQSTIYSALKKYIKEFDLEGYFVNHGIISQDNLARLYSQCDLGLFPSLLETFSATLLEYMRFELPIVASDLDFNREVAKDAAVYFTPHDAFDFAQKVYQVYSDMNLRMALLKKGNGRLSLFSNDVNKYEETLNFLQRVAINNSID